MPAEKTHTKPQTWATELALESQQSFWNHEKNHHLVGGIPTPFFVHFLCLLIFAPKAWKLLRLSQKYQTLLVGG